MNALTLANPCHARSHFPCYLKAHINISFIVEVNILKVNKLTNTCILVNLFIIMSRIINSMTTFQHVYFQCPLFDSHPSIHHSNIGVRLRSKSAHLQHVQSSCSTLIYQYSAPLWTFVTTHYSFVVFTTHIDEQICKVLKFGFDPRQFTWVKKQSTRACNLIAHINVPYILHLDNINHGYFVSQQLH